MIASNQFTISNKIIRTTAERFLNILCLKINLKSTKKIFKKKRPGKEKEITFKSLFRFPFNKFM